MRRLFGLMSQRNSTKDSGSLSRPSLRGQVRLGSNNYMVFIDEHPETKDWNAFHSAYPTAEEAARAMDDILSSLNQPAVPPVEVEHPWRDVA